MQIWNISMSFHDPDKGKRMGRRVRVLGAFAALTIRYLLLCLMPVFSHLKRCSRREGTLSILFIAISPGPYLVSSQNARSQNL